MTRSALRAVPLAAALLPLAFMASATRGAPLQARAPRQLLAPFHRELGSLILEGVPPLDAGLAARIARYEAAREATFLDWLPDGSMLVSTRFGDVAEIHRVTAPLGMRQQLTYAAEPITAAAAAPTPSITGFAFLEDRGGNENAQVYYFPLTDPRIGRDTGASRLGGAVGRASSVAFFPGHRANTGGLGNPGMSAGAYGARLLTDGRSRHGALVWSHDGKRLAFYGNERDPATFDIYTVDVSAGRKPRLLVAGSKGLWRPLDWSPDGRTLLIEQTVSATASRLYLADSTTGALTPVEPDGRAADIRAARFAPDGRGIFVVSDDKAEFGTLRRIDLVTHDSQEIVGSGGGGTDGAVRHHIEAWLGRGDAGPTSLPWGIEDFDVSADGRYIAYVMNEDGRSRLAILDTARRLTLSPPTIQDGVIGGLRFDRTGRRLAFSAENAVTPRDVYVYDVERGTVERWTRSEPGPLCAASAVRGLPAAPRFVQASTGSQPGCPAFVPAELVHFATWDRASGGRRMLSAYLYRPRTAGPHPVLIDVHGGPQAQARPRFDPFIQFLVGELGYAVVAPNVRGSSGYGKTFLGLDDGLLRQDAVRDIGSLLVWIDLQPDLDRGHVAILGTGYGGYLALASLADYNDRLRGAIDVCGISDLVRFLENTAPWRRDQLRAEYGDVRDPAIRDFLSRISPIARTQWIQRPLLVVQGLNDPRVPPSESTDLVASLRARGNDVWYLAARDEGHGFHKQSNRGMYDEIAAMFLQRLSAEN